MSAATTDPSVAHPVTAIIAADLAPTADSSTAPPASPDTLPQTSPNFPTFEKMKSQVTHASRALTLRQLAAVDMLLAAHTDAEVCKKLKIDRKTLYNWRHHNPLFVRELNRRSHAAWNDTAHRLRALVIKALDALAQQLTGIISDAGRTRAARTLIQLVINQKLAPTGPTNLNDILDNFLAAAQPHKPDGATPAYSDAQRQQMLDDLLAESADVEPEPRRVGSAHQPRANNSPALDTPGQPALSAVEVSAGSPSDQSAAPDPLVQKLSLGSPTDRR